MDVSVIIVNYNTSRLVQQCVDTILSLTNGLSYEVIVVDNASKDDDVEMLRTDKRFRLIEAGDNLGFGRANNLGLKYAQGEYIFFLNSDTLLLNNAIKMMYDFAKGYAGRLGAVGTLLEDRQGNKIHSCGRFHHVGANLAKIAIGPFVKLLGRTPAAEPDLSGGHAKVDYVTGADLFVSKAVLTECGAFNPSFFMYSEEMELEHRFMKAGYDNVLMSGPRIIHLEGESSAKSGRSRFLRDTLRQQRSEFIYFKLTEPLWKYCSYRFLLPLARQTLWLNPHVSLKDKWTYMKSLFQSVTLSVES